MYIIILVGLWQMKAAELTVKTWRPILAASFSFWDNAIFRDPALKMETFNINIHFIVIILGICSSQQSGGFLIRNRAVLKEFFIYIFFTPLVSTITAAASN